jgi:hypothetical protein
MAAIENLELKVTADIAKAVAKLEELQEELQNVAEAIESVDAIGKDGIDVRTSVDDLDGELARIMAEIEAFEATQSIDIPMNVHDRSVEEILGRAGAGSVAELTGRHQDNLLAGLQGANLDFGGFNRPRGAGIGGGGDTDLMRTFRKSIGRVSDKFSELRTRMDNFDLRMSDMHNMMATLIPLLFIFIGAVPAVVTALAGLAAAAFAAAASLGALAGFGAMGVGMTGGQFQMDNLTEIWNQISEGFIEAFAPLAERLEPLFRDAVDGLVMLFEQIANQGDALMEITDEARGFGQFIMDFLPDALRTLAALVEALSPILAQIGDAINDNFNSFVRQLVYWTEQAVPVVADLVQTIIKALPTIISIGIQFASVADEVLKLIGAFWNIITVGGALEGVMGLLIATVLLAATAFSLLNKAAVRFALRGVASAVTSLYRFMTAIALANTQMTIFGTTMLTSALSGIVSLTAGLIQSVAAFIGFSLSAYQAAIAAAAFWTAVTLGAAAFLVPMITGMAMEFLGLSENIDQATNSLKEFDRVSGRAGGDFNPYGGTPPSGGGGAANPSGGSKTVINMETSGDPNEDSSNARYLSFRQGRTTGGTN